MSKFALLLSKLFACRLPFGLSTNARERRVERTTFLLAALLLVLTEVVWQQGALNTLEANWNDLWFRVSGLRHSDQQVVIVEIDEATLNEFPDDPLVFWTPHFARAMAVLRQAGVRLIALDMLFSISPEHWLEKVGGQNSLAARQYDRGFREQLAAGNVLLAAAHRNGPDPLLPRAEFLAVLPNLDLRGHLGATNLELDADGTWRSMSALAPGAAEARPGGLQLLSFPLLIALRAEGLATTTDTWVLGDRPIHASDPPRRVAFSGPPGTVPRIAMRDLLAPGAEHDPRVQALRGKIAIVGPAYGGSNDLHLTPYGHGVFSSRLMSGPEIHAQTVEALLAGRQFVEPGMLARTLFMGTLLLIGACAWLRLNAWHGTTILLASLLLLSVSAYGLHRHLVLIPLMHAQFATILLFAGCYGLRLVFGDRERARIRSMFTRYVSRDLVDTMIDSDEMPALGGKSLEATVLFCDIRNFTSLSEILPAEAIVTMLNHWFACACAILQAEGAFIDKFIGDAVMAEFGIPLSQPDHARRAIRAALRLKAAAADIQAWMAQEHIGTPLPPFAIGIGLHTGIVVAGNIGSPDRMEYTVIGDTANLASRLESATKSLGSPILASRATLEAAGRGIVTGSSANLTVKGRAEPVDVFAIEGLEE